MKTGDSKQAIILSIVAIGAVGFLGKTLLSSFGGGAPTPAPVAQEAAKEATPTTTSTTPPTTSGTPIASSGTTAESEESDLGIIRNSFYSNKKKEPKEAKSTPKAKNIVRDENGNERSMPDAGLDGFLPTMPADPTKGGRDIATNEKLPSSRKEDKETEKPVKELEVRYEGYVNAGSPIAVIRIGESTFNADIGDSLPNGVQVETISDSKVTIIVKGTKKTVWLGRTVKI